MLLERKPYYIHSHDERAVRLFYANYFNEVYGIENWPFELDYQRTVSFVKIISTKLGMDLDDGQVIAMSFLLAITLTRESQGFSLPENILPEPDQHQKILKETEDLVNDLIDPLGWKLPECWVASASFTLFYYHYSWDNPNEKKRISNKILSFIHTIHTALDIPITENDKQEILYQLCFVYTRHKVYSYSDKMLYDQYTYTSRSIHRTYIAYFLVVQKALKELEAEMHFPWFTQYRDRILYWIMIKWDQLPILLDQKRKRISILVISNLSNQHANLLADLIRINFENKADIYANQISLINLKLQESLDSADFDIFVSNFSSDVFPKNRHVVVDPIPSTKNWGDLRRVIECNRLIQPNGIDYLKSK